MKTEQLITMLSSGVDPVDPHVLQRRFVLALSWGLAGTALLMLVMLGVRPDFAEATGLLMFWMKLAFTATLLIGAAFAVARLSRPGARLGYVPLALAAPVIAVWLASAIALLNAAPDEQQRLIYGNTWATCPITIAALSVLLFAPLTWAMKGFAPTHLALAGGAVGLLAGAGGALIYALHCCEMSVPFLGIWYVAGMTIPAVVGAVIGPRILRW